MKTWRAHGAGTSRLSLDEIAMPTLGRGEVLVRVRAVSLNYRDRLQVEHGAYERVGFPFVPCSDMAGEVVALGEAAERFAVGDRVINNFNAGWIDGVPPRQSGEIPSLGGPISGTMSEFLALPEEWLVKTPQTLSDVEASTLPCTGLTAWTSLVDLGRVQPGQTVVVQGSGSFSLFALQIANLLGAETIVTTTTDDKAERLRELGATHVIDRTSSRWEDGVLELTGGNGADHILEVAGGENLGRSIRALAPNGRISLVGVMEGFDASFPSVPAIHAFATIQAIYVGNRAGLERFARAVELNGLTPVVDSTFAFADFVPALDRLAEGPFGKVVITL